MAEKPLLDEFAERHNLTRVRELEEKLAAALRERDEARAALDEAQKAWVADADLKNRIRELEAERDAFDWARQNNLAAHATELAALREALTRALGYVDGWCNRAPDDYIAAAFAREAALLLLSTTPKTEEGGK